jgi:hypothetical protein
MAPLTFSTTRPTSLDHLAGRRDFSLPFALLAALAALGFGGCSALNLPKEFPGFEKKDAPSVPSRMTDMWTFTVLHQPGERGVRGFGGRVMFYNNDSEKPIKVEGTLTVFAFDTAERDGEQAVPLRKFVFLPEQIEKHYSPSKLGHSYSFWLPWDEVGGPEQQISLIARFESRGGALLVGSASRQSLTGAKPGAAHREQATQGAVQPAAHLEVAETPTITTATINLTPGFVQRSGGAGAAQAAEPRAAGAVSAGQDPRAEAPQEPAPATRSSPGRFPARRGVAAGPRTDPVRKQPSRATWPPALPATPRSGSSGGVPSTTPDAPPTPFAPSADGGGDTRTPP